MNTILFSVLFIVGVSFVNAKSLELPSYLTSCRWDHPNLNACALASARAAVPKFINGDRKYRIPNLNPVSIDEIQVDGGVLGLNIILKNLIFHGFKDLSIDSLNFDLKAERASYQIMIPRAEVIFNYTIDGKILILPITGSGPGNMTVENLMLDYSYDWDFKKKKDGLTYCVPKNPGLKYTLSRLYVKLENLFNGNQLLGDQMNVFMDENWRELVKDIGPIFGDTFTQTTTNIITNIFDLVGMEKAFPGFSNATMN